MLVLIALAIISFGQLALCTLLLFESRRTKRRDQQIFAVFCVLAVLWTIAVGYLSQLDTGVTATNVGIFSLVNKVAFVLSFALLTVLYLFSFFYPSRRPIGIVGKTVLGIGAIGTLFSPVTEISGKVSAGPDGGLYAYGHLSMGMALYALFVLILVLLSQYHVLHRTHDAQLKKQAKTLSIGITLTILQAVVFVVIVPTFLGQQQILYAFGYAAPSFLIAFVGYGLLKQGLFNISFIIARTIAYTLLIVTAAVFYVFPVVIISTFFFETPLTSKAILFLALVTLIVASLFHPIKLYFNKVTNRFFYRDYYDPQSVLDNLSNLLVGTVDITKVITGTKDILDGSLRPTFVTFHIARQKQHDALHTLMKDLDKLHLSNISADELELNDHPHLLKIFRKQNIFIAIKLRTSHDNVGLLLLGGRKSGDPYTKADRRLLGVVADELALAIQNAIHFQEIERFNATLQQKVDDATRKLRHTNQKLRTMDQTKDDFISMASHQLRTPLTSVKGYVSMVLDGDAGEITQLQRKLLNQSFISSQRMVYLISDLLNVSRLRTGKFIIEPVPSNLAKVIKDEIEQLQETAKGRNLELTYNRPEHFPTLMLDETKIRQVIMNFIDNAIYYTPSGGHIAVNLVDKPKSIEFTVTDDGIGVSKAEQHHLFTKFFRAQNAKRARPDGTGLGLFMAKKVIIAQGGAIIFKSQEHKGSTFGFSFAKEKLAKGQSHIEVTEAS